MTVGIALSRNFGNLSYFCFVDDNSVSNMYMHFPTGHFNLAEGNPAG